jgi:tetratricopeptide (TPR) repeat protein
MKKNLEQHYGKFKSLSSLKGRLILAISIVVGLSASAAGTLQHGPLTNQRPDSLQYLQQLHALSLNSKNMAALLSAGKLATQLAGRSSCLEKQIMLLTEASNLSSRAIAIDPSNCEAHLNHIVALGMLAETTSSPRERLRHARIINDEAHLIIQLNPNHASAHFVLGKLNEAIGGMSFMERLIASSLLGGIPEDMSYEKAKFYYARAIALNPHYILFYYGLAKVQLAQGDDAAALKTLEYALSLRNVEADDVIRKRNCQLLISKITGSAL